MRGKNLTILVFLALCIAATQVRAQHIIRSTDTSSKVVQQQVYVKPKGPKQLTHEMTGGIRLNTNGWSVFTDIGKLKAPNPKYLEMFHNVRIFQIEFTEKKSQAEYKSTSTNGSGSNTYIYGKINNFYALKLGWGFRKMLVGKPDPGTVSIHWVNTFGISVGFLKPYYLNLISDPSAVKYDESTSQDFLNQNLIEGNAGFSKGISEVKIIPGGHFKSSLHFDFSGNHKIALAAEVGFNVEYYSQPIPLMALQAAEPYFADLFIAIMAGKRW